MSNEKRKRRLTAIDFFIIFAALAVLVAAGLRFYENKTSDLGAGPEDVVLEEYIVSFESKGMKESTANLLEKGELFYLTGGQTEFGVIEEISSITPAKIRVELTNGELKTDVYAEKNGNNTKVDVTGTFRVSGYRDDDNLMLVGGEFYIAPNLPVTVFSNNISLPFTVTGVEKVN
ncbi:MAG: hypothetical protein IKU19_03345 [Clostridia bacterium]|nr:hypothetical protein [Clostridia bacterium]